MGEFSVRFLEGEADAGTLRRLYDTVIVPSFPAAERETIEKLRRVLAADELRGAVAMTPDGDPVGALFLEWFADIRAGLLCYFAIRPDLRGRGIGRQLLAVAGPRWRTALRPRVVFAEAEDPNFADAAQLGGPLGGGLDRLAGPVGGGLDRLAGPVGGGPDRLAGPVASDADQPASPFTRDAGHPTSLTASPARWWRAPGPGRDTDRDKGPGASGDRTVGPIAGDTAHPADPIAGDTDHPAGPRASGRVHAAATTEDGNSPVVSMASRTGDAAGPADDDGGQAADVTHDGRDHADDGDDLARLPLCANHVSRDHAKDGDDLARLSLYETTVSRDHADYGDDLARLRLYAEFGAKRLPIRYLQPELNPGAGRLLNLLLLVVEADHVVIPAPDRIDSAVVEDFLVRYFARTEGGVVREDDSQLAQLRNECRQADLLPLERLTAERGP